MDFQLVVLRGRSASTTVKLADGITTVGRQDDCQLRIASAQVSRKHCQLFEHKGHLLVKDLGSSNGTYVNGKKIGQQRVLETGDELAIGPVKFRVEKATAGAVKGKAAKPAPGSGDGAVAAVAAASATPVEALGDDEPILGTPVEETVLAEDAPDFEVTLEEPPISLADDDVFEIDFEDEDSDPDKPPVSLEATPLPASNAVAPAAPAEDKHEKPAEDDLGGEDAVADFLMNLKIDEE